jgi:hypothetical protein
MSKINVFVENGHKYCVFQLANKMWTWILRYNREYFKSEFHYHTVDEAKRSCLDSLKIKINNDKIKEHNVEQLSLF